MLNNFFKATVRRLAELPWEDFCNLFTWPSKSNLQAENPNLLIAKATNPSGEVVAYVTAESILLVDGYVFNPKNTPIDLQRAGDALDSALAQRAGVKMWVVIPNDAPIMEGERFIRVYERKIHQRVTTTQRLGCSDLQSRFATFN